MITLFSVIFQAISFFLIKNESDVDNIKTLYESYTIFDNIPVVLFKSPDEFIQIQ